MKTTVCIPTRLDNLNYLLELLKTIESQNVLPDKVLIVASGRPLPEIKKNLKTLKSKISSELNFEFITSTKSGLGNARNMGIDLCKTEIIIFGDDDDIWREDKIEKTLRAVEKGYPCLIKHFHNSIFENKIKPFPLKIKPKANSFSVGFSNLIGGGSSISGSTSVFRAIKFINYQYCEDWDFWIRSYLAGIKIVQISEELVTYRIHSKRMTKNLKKTYYFENLIRLKFLFKSILFLFGLIIGFLKSTLVILIRIMIIQINKIFK